MIGAAENLWLFGGDRGARPEWLFTYVGMGSPGLAALLTRAILQRNLRGEGWGLGRPRFLLYAYLLPFVPEGPVYVVAWKTGLAGFYPPAIVQATRHPLGFAPATPAGSTLLMATGGVALAATGALGEELAWRGLLVPELARLGSFRMVSLVSGAVWALFHFPWSVLGRGAGDLPLWYALPMFSVTITLAAHVFAWLRLESGSVWPGVVLHAAHDPFLIGFLSAPTYVNGPYTQWIMGESGCGMAVAYGVAAVLVSRHMRRVAARRGSPQETLETT